MGYVLAIFKFFLSALRSIKNYVHVTPSSLCISRLSDHTVEPRSSKNLSFRKDNNNNPMGDSRFFSLFFFVLQAGRSFCLYSVLLAGRSRGFTLPFDADYMIIFEIKVGGT